MITLTIKYKILKVCSEKKHDRIKRKLSYQYICILKLILAKLVGKKKMSKKILFGNSMCGHPWEPCQAGMRGCQGPFANLDGLSQRICFSFIENKTKIRSQKNP